MMLNIRAVVLGTVLLSVVLARLPNVSPNSVLRIELDSSPSPVSPTLYGVFFEEINHAGDGGLYSEMIRNGSFEDSASEPQGWTPIGGAKLIVESSHPLNNNNIHALRIDSEQSGGG